MKRKTFFISVFIAFTILLLSTVVLAAVNNSQVQDKILTWRKNIFSGRKLQRS